MELLILAAPAAYDSFGALLRAQRHRALLSQEELAARSGLSERTIRNLEANRVRVPRASTTRLLAKALGLSGPDREVFISACRRNPDLELTGNLLARGSGPARLPEEVLARLPVHLNGLFSGDDQLALDANPPTSDEPLLTVEISASPRLVGIARSTLRMHWADRATRRVDNGHVDSNPRGLRDNPADDANVAAATLCSARAAKNISALAARKRGANGFCA